MKIQMIILMLVTMMIQLLIKIYPVSNQKLSLLNPCHLGPVIQGFYLFGSCLIFKTTVLLKKFQVVSLNFWLAFYMIGWNFYYLKSIQVFINLRFHEFFVPSEQYIIISYCQNRFQKSLSAFKIILFHFWSCLLPLQWPKLHAFRA